MCEHGYRAVCGGDLVGGLDLVVGVEAVVEFDLESGSEAIDGVLKVAVEWGLSEPTK